MVGKLKPRQVFHRLCIFTAVFFLFAFSVSVFGDVHYQRPVPPEDKTTTVLLSKTKQSGQNYWAKLRETLGHGHSYFFPPNIDFRGKDDQAVMGAGEKVIEAAAKSFEKSKETVEEAAKSAAEVASDVAEGVKEKIKRSLSGRQTPQQSEVVSEL